MTSLLPFCSSVMSLVLMPCSSTMLVNHLQLSDRDASSQ
jgi:hypothetical protein